MQASLVLDYATAEKLLLRQRLLRSTRPESILCFPLITQRELCGVLCLEGSRARRTFTDSWLAALELLVSQIGISLRSVRANADLQRERRKRREVEEELAQVGLKYPEAPIGLRRENFWEE